MNIELHLDKGRMGNRIKF
ncbi:Protein of unknown function [Bacillus wiedmannii]|uniref:Uncharacterized protein n=1 Tax=Bacillus wiedmannii TaxID=1890302 RepID=A0A1C4AKN5_9BACI|nr:Protein of unknown function [Bacillus wiedmannii]